MQRAQAMMLPDGKRLHLNHGPIDLIVEANGEPDAIHAAYAAATHRFATILEELVSELPLLRREISDSDHGLKGDVSRAMARAVLPFAAHRVTPMAAVAGAVADEILRVLTGAAPLRRAYVNNGGDIAVFLSEGQSFAIASPGGLIEIANRSPSSSAVCPNKNIARHPGEGGDPLFSPKTQDDDIETLEPWVPAFAGMTEVRDRQFNAAYGQASPLTFGVATSGWRGRSFSLGIADAVTVIARTAAEADAAATMIANAVDLPGSPKIKRQPANEIAPESDLGERLVTVDVLSLDDSEIEAALAAGRVFAESCIARGLITSASLMLGGTTKSATSDPPPLAGEMSSRSGDGEGLHACLSPLRRVPRHLSRKRERIMSSESSHA